jgi:hypothetical protein
LLFAVIKTRLYLQAEFERVIQDKLKNDETYISTFK